MTYYGRWTYKYEEAARQGALGMLIVHETEPASYGWNTVKNSNANAQFDIVRDDPAKSHPLLQGWIQRDLAADLFKAAGLDFEAQKKAAQTASFPAGARSAARPSRPPTRSIQQHRQPQHRWRSCRDQAAGRDRHLHRPLGPPGRGPARRQGRPIYNGAVDNASGVSGLIELGRAFAHAPHRPHRDVHGGDGRGEGPAGLGILRHHPLYPLAKTVANINIDALDTDGLAKDITTSGSQGHPAGRPDHGRARRTAATSRPTPTPKPATSSAPTTSPSPRPACPAISFNSGEDLVNGGVAAGKAWSGLRGPPLSPARRRMERRTGT